MKEKAISLGLLQEEGEEVSDEQLSDILFSAGFSTAKEVSLHAGRGIGLNLVRDQTTSLGGTIKVHTQKGSGTEFVITVSV
ncbi:MAG: hypothetical protein Ta2G_07110 [Termitinemataceae bacterium]|nr:MAG: hypothetical protein Ta2G_07110 [Termitinemataceae bacterium]